MSRYKFVEKDYGLIIGSNARDKRASARARKENLLIDIELELIRETWVFQPPSNMVIQMSQDAGAFPAGLVLSLPQESGRELVRRKLCRVLEHDVAIDAEVDSDLETVLEAIA